MKDTSQYVEFLVEQTCRYRDILQDIFGPYDQSFVFGSIKKSIDEDDVPHTNFPNGFHVNGGCIIDIHISTRPWRNCSRDQGTWQVAHESVLELTRFGGHPKIK